MSVTYQCMFVDNLQQSELGFSSNIPMMLRHRLALAAGSTAQQAFVPILEFIGLVVKSKSHFLPKFSHVSTVPPVLLQPLVDLSYIN